LQTFKRPLDGRHQAVFRLDAERIVVAHQAQRTYQPWP
jgi:hypothetical protein